MDTEVVKAIDSQLVLIYDTLALSTLPDGSLRFAMMDREYSDGRIDAQTLVDSIFSRLVDLRVVDLPLSPEKCATMMLGWQK